MDGLKAQVEVVIPLLVCASSWTAGVRTPDGHWFVNEPMLARIDTPRSTADAACERVKALGHIPLGTGHWGPVTEAKELQVLDARLASWENVQQAERARWAEVKRVADGGQVAAGA